MVAAFAPGICTMLVPDTEPIVVNNAELIIPINTEAASDLPAHIEIILGGYNKDSVIVNTVDGYSESHFSGVVQENEFVFNIILTTKCHSSCFMIVKKSRRYLVCFLRIMIRHLK